MPDCYAALLPQPRPLSTLKMADPIKRLAPLGFPFETPDPFLFCVYHADDYPAGDDKMQAPRKGNGADFDWSQPYRMYHGDRIPGFPQHPHRGFETLTATTEGLVDHTDSQGNAGRYGQGDLQWMTAGAGIVHGEMFPLINKDQPNTLRLFQIWLNLPAASKFAEPAFVMHWNERVPRVSAPGSEVRVFAGQLGDAKGLPPPPSSWAASEDNDVAVWMIELDAGGSFTIPAARGGSATNRCIYTVDGGELAVGARAVKQKAAVTLDAAVPAPITNNSGRKVSILMLQGKPIGEPVAQHGPFVMNTQAEIRQCFEDYRRTQFGGWPWPEDAMVFPRDKGRIALFRGKEEYPPA